MLKKKKKKKEKGKENLDNNVLYSSTILVETATSALQTVVLS